MKYYLAGYLAPQNTSPFSPFKLHIRADIKVCKRVLTLIFRPDQSYNIFESVQLHETVDHDNKMLSILVFKCIQFCTNNMFYY